MFDINTKNKSFLETSKCLKENGVRNYKFMLQLYDSGLKSIDVYSNNLSKKIKSRIFAEICRNEWYFLREVVRLSFKNEEFKLDLLSCATIYSLKNNVNKILITSSRQTRKTNLQQIHLLWETLFDKDNTNNIVFANSIENALLSSKFFKDTVLNLPEWLINFTNSGNGIYRQEVKNINTNVIEYRATPGQDETAKNVLNEKENPDKIIISDFPFSKKFNIVFDNILHVMNNKQIILESTAKKLKNDNGQYIDENLKYIASIILNSCNFEFKMYDMNEIKLKKYIASNSFNGMLHIKYSLEDLGYNKESFNYLKEDVFDQEINLNWNL